MSEIVQTKGMERKRTENSGSTTLRETMWLAGRDVRASWLSYVAAVLIAAFFGFLGTVQFANALSGDGGAFGAGLLDFYLLCIVPALGTNLVLNRDYYANFSMDTFDDRLSFLKSLPVSSRAVISARALCALLAIAVSAPAFFSAPYLLSANLSDGVGSVGYLCFCLFWVGYAVVATGILYIYSSFAFNWNFRNVPLLAIGYLGFNIVTSVVFGLLFDGGLAVTILELAGDHGLLVAVVPLLVGAVTMAVCIKKSETGLARRDVG